MAPELVAEAQAVGARAIHRRYVVEIGEVPKRLGARFSQVFRVTLEIPSAYHPLLFLALRGDA